MRFRRRAVEGVIRRTTRRAGAVALVPFVALTVAGAAAGAAARAQAPVAPDVRDSTEARITDLLARMTVDEKIDALGTDPTVPRLGIVGTGHVEGLHGLALGGPGGWQGRNQTVIPTTQFPQARGLGQTWDPALLERVAAVEAHETRYASGRYHRGGMVVRAPNTDLSRDPRWGRSEESYGEDPFLVGTLAAAYSRGLQGRNPRYWEAASLLKHFLANSNEDGRDSSSSNFDAREFHEYYAVPFRMAIQQGGANAMMASYNAWNGVPMTANPVLRDVVMKAWGFDGILCTDAGALTNMVRAHHAYRTMPEAAAAAIHAGINQFLDNYKPSVRDALRQGLITTADLDRNLRGVFRVMTRLGMLDPNDRVPYAGIGFADAAAGDPWNASVPRALARTATQESIVLLKNERAVLPLNATAVRSIAVIGPLADSVALDWYSGTPPLAVTPLAGIRQRAGAGVRVDYATGMDSAEVARLAGAADVTVVVIGNHPTCNAGWAKCPTPSDGKEAVDRKSLTLAQESIARAALAANPRTVVVLQASFPFTTTWTQAHVPAVLAMTHNSEAQGTALADVLFGDYNPAGRLTQTWVASMDQLPPMMDYDLRHGRTYQYLRTAPLYPFGYGLSYTRFTYSALHVSSRTVADRDTLAVSFDVRNAGTRDGDEVVQLYVAHRGSAVARPMQELKAFRRVAIPAGRSATVTLPLAASDLAYWSEADGRFVVERDAIELRVGGSSADLPLRTTVTMRPSAR